MSAYPAGLTRDIVRDAGVRFVRMCLADGLTPEMMAHSCGHLGDDEHVEIWGWYVFVKRVGNVWLDSPAKFSLSSIVRSAQRPDRPHVEQSSLFGEEVRS